MNIIEKIKEFFINKSGKRVRAIIIENNKVLLMHRIKQGHEYWTFPGGGVDKEDKSLEDGLKRECKEELGVEVEIKDLYFKEFDTFSNQIQYYYICKIIGGELGTGNGPEWINRDVEKYGTYEIVWIPISELKDKIVYPFKVRDKIINETSNNKPF